jgi:hypothetical protein
MSLDYNQGIASDRQVGGVEAGGDLGTSDSSEPNSVGAKTADMSSRWSSRTIWARPGASPELAIFHQSISCYTIVMYS